MMLPFFWGAKYCTATSNRTAYDAVHAAAFVISYLSCVALATS